MGELIREGSFSLSSITGELKHKRLNARLEFLGFYQLPVFKNPLERLQPMLEQELFITYKNKVFERAYLKRIGRGIMQMSTMNT
jgi:hypothetical protein